MKKKLGKIPILRKIYESVRKLKYFIGVEIWPTKSYDIWIFLQILLYKIKPNSLVEFGSGRSTNYLAEYALKNNAKFVSIEQNNNYVKKGKKGLINSMLSDEFIYYVPIINNWFDTNKLDKIILFKPEFVLIDAPGGSFNGGSRNCQLGNDYIKKLISEVKLVIVDDMHRDDVIQATQKFINNKFLKISMRYDVGNNESNIITFYYLAEYHAVVENIVKFLNIEDICVG
jgi:hypothetical protein